MENKDTNIMSITTEITDINNLATTLWYSGCRLFCNGCQNSQLKDFCKGMDLNTVKEKLTERRKFTDWLVHSGGNPVDSVDLLIEVAEFAKSLGFKQFLFCGYTEEEMIRLIGEEKNQKLLALIDYIKVGAYEQSKDKNNFNCSEYHFATLNQQVIKASEDRKQWNIFYAYSPNCPIPKLQIV